KKQSTHASTGRARAARLLPRIAPFGGTLATLCAGIGGRSCEPPAARLVREKFVCVRHGLGGFEDHGERSPHRESNLALHAVANLRKALQPHAFGRTGALRPHAVVHGLLALFGAVGVLIHAYTFASQKPAAIHSASEPAPP